MSVERCGNCKFYCLNQQRTRAIADDEALHPEDFEAECRRYPPVRGDADYYGRLSDAPAVQHECFSGPIVQTTYWCGEWKPRSA